MIALFLALALTPTDKQYRQEAEAIVSEDQRQLYAMALPRDEREVAQQLIFLDSYLVLNELRKFPRGTTRAKVDRLLAQLSRDMESIPR